MNDRDMNDKDRPIGVLVMAHGTPASAAEVESFYSSIRRGSPPPPELLAQLEDRYRAIGGLSPLTEVTRAQVAGLRAGLEARAPGRYVVAYGAKHVQPSIEDGVAELVDAGAERIVGIVLTPHASSLGSGAYLERAAAAAATPTPSASGTAVTFVGVRSWHRTEGLCDLLAERTQRAINSLEPSARGKVALFFTAHSVPRQALAKGDAYPRQVAESAADIAAHLGLDAVDGLSWDVAWQSAGRTSDPWVGPSLLSEIDRVAGRGATAVVVCPVGFVADHLEVLYDLDIEAARAAAGHGLAFARTASLNDDPRFLAVLGRAVDSALDAAAPSVAAPSGGAAATGSGARHG